MSRKVCSLLLVLFVPLILAGQSVYELHTDQTRVRLQATLDGPRLLSVQTEGAEAWENQATEQLITSATVNGISLPLKWNLIPSLGTHDPRHVVLIYEASSPHLRLTWEWQAPAVTGPIEHRVRIENLTPREVWIPLQPSFSFSFAVPKRAAIRHLYIDKGAGKPTAIGTHQQDVPIGYQWEGTSSTYAVDNGPREVIPWFMLERTRGSGDGWYLGVEFSGRILLTLQRDEHSMRGVVGLNPNPGPFLTRLQPHGSFDVPPIFLGAFAGDADQLGNVLRPWVRQVLNNPVTWADHKYPLLVNNSWGSGMQVDDALARRMIQDSSELGLEMFHIDAGWFRSPGDWHPDPKKFPKGLASLAEEAHRRGLKFGIWSDWAQAGTQQRPGALNVVDPATKDWLVADTPAGWKPEEFVGRTIDIGLPAARKYAEREVKRIVSSYKLDMLEHDGYLVTHACSRNDHPHAAPPHGYEATVTGSGVGLPLASNSTDVSYHAVRAYYDIYANLRKEHPDLLLEICNDGGRMVDFGSASHGDYFSITDTYDPLSNRQAFYDASHVLPAAMLEDYVEKWPAANIENFRYMLRSGMMGWLTIMQDTNAWTSEQHSAAKAEFALYKSDLRPLIRDADLYHISDRPDGTAWDGIEYFDPHRAVGVVYAFHGTAEDETVHVFALKGIRPDQRYRLRFHDATSPEAIVSGSQLLKTGLIVHLPLPHSSELIFFEEAER